MSDTGVLFSVAGGVAGADGAGATQILVNATDGFYIGGNGTGGAFGQGGRGGVGAGGLNSDDVGPEDGVGYGSGGGGSAGSLTNGGNGTDGFLRIRW